MSIIEQFPLEWKKQWQTANFHQVSLIQEKSFDTLKNGASVLGISPTGTGKTLAYLWPLLLNTQVGKRSQLLILAPSQELAVQIQKVAQEWGGAIGLNAQSLIGGANIKRQIEQLKKQPEILIGTPGRVLELIKIKKLKSHLFQTIVVDEVDQLLKEKEWNATVQILKSAPVDYQLAFYSATGNQVLPTLQALVPNLQILDCSKEDQSAGTITHYFLSVPQRKKSEMLRRLAYTPEFSAIIFFNQVSELGVTEERLLYEGLPVISLASDQNKKQRKLAIDLFTNKKAQYLLTTDIASRGLDFSEIPYVVNTEIPLSMESYIHRAGRVGRMGAVGAVVTFVDEQTKKMYQRLLNKAQLSAKELFVYDGAIQLEAKNQERTFKQAPTNKQKDNYRKNKGKKND